MISSHQHHPCPAADAATTRSRLHTFVPALAGERPAALFDTFEGRE